MTPLLVTLVVTTLLVSLVAGFLFAFAVVGMPGIGRLEDRAFVRAFQVMDGVIQNNQPLFMLVWVGSVLGVLASIAMALTQLTGLDRTLVLVGGATYLVGVQMPTASINVPLNNRLQSVDVAAVDDAAVATARADFERSWNRANVVRTIFATIAALLMMSVLTRI